MYFEIEKPAAEIFTAGLCYFEYEGAKGAHEPPPWEGD